MPIKKTKKHFSFYTIVKLRSVVNRKVDLMLGILITVLEKFSSVHKKIPL